VASSDNQTSNFFLPDFCGLNSVFAVVILSELFALILTLAASHITVDPWQHLALTSLFMQWVGLCCAAVLCRARPLLAKLDALAAAGISYLILLLVILILSELAFHLVRNPDLPRFGPHHTAFLLSNMSIGAIISALMLRYLFLQHQWKERVRAEAEARLQALQARIRPHFLFNSINTVTSLIHDKPDMAEEALLDLADLFRASMREENRHITFSEELELTRRYLHVESLRLGDRLSIEWHVDAIPEEALLPPLVLQPLVENAVYHGIEPRRDGGTVTLTGSEENGMIKLEIGNPLPEEKATQRDGNRLAVRNIRERLEAHYGQRASLDTSISDNHYLATLILPLEVHE
jgi:two-component system, LytTR family, sensor histidine kinase AlgZ